MRTTKTSKNSTPKLIITFPDSNPKISTSSQTALEIALKIDENGMTSASNLQNYIQLISLTGVEKNIKNNKFTIENEDCIPFTVESEQHNPNPKRDYKITSNFAKQLSMTVKNERGQETCKYFIACE